MGGENVDVDEFVDARATSFNKAQQGPEAKSQTVQYKATGFRNFQHVLTCSVVLFRDQVGGEFLIWQAKPDYVTAGRAQRIRGGTGVTSDRRSAWHKNAPTARRTECAHTPTDFAFSTRSNNFYLKTSQGFPR